MWYSLKISCIILVILSNRISEYPNVTLYRSDLVTLIINIVTGNALECYVCSNQYDNKDKCLKSIKICEQGEDVCLTEIKWGSKFSLVR